PMSFANGKSENNKKSHGGKLRPSRDILQERDTNAKRAIAAYFKNRFMAVALLSTPAFNTRLPSTGTLP
ncbi:MAG: hypothetical protein ACLQVM_27705, partial [Terriglobia bacterium]